LPADANAGQKIEHAQQGGALIFYNKKKMIYYANL
jgi:hypothetical protein